MKKKTILITLAVILSAIFGVIFAYGPNPDIEKLKEGDVIFHASDSRQAPMLRLATSSPITHCGIVIEKGGKLYVLEAEGKVQLTPIQTFINRGIGKTYCVRRPKNEVKGRVKYKGYLGIPYHGCLCEYKHSQLHPCHSSARPCRATPFKKRKNLQLLEVKKACGRKSCLDPDFFARIGEL